MTNDNLLTISLFRGVTVDQPKKQHDIGNGGNHRFLFTLMYVVEARVESRKREIQDQKRKLLGCTVFQSKRNPVSDWLDYIVSEGCIFYCNR
jgi:hypothetical protein